MSSTYNLRPTSYSPAHLDRELALRGAHTSGSLERKQERLQRFVDAEKNAPVKHHQKVIERLDNRIEELRRTIVRPPTPSRRSSRIEELQRSIVNIPTTTPEVRRSSRISQLLNQYLGY